MELPAQVLIHNELLGLKGSPGTLLRVSVEGYYELNCTFGEKTHRLMLPISTTVLIGQDPEETFGADFEVER